MKRPLIRLASVAGVSLWIVALPAQALEMAGSMYIVAGYGTTRVADQPMIESTDSIVRASIPKLSRIDSGVSSGGHGYKLQLGYEFTPNFAVEGGFVDLGRFTYTTSYDIKEVYDFPGIHVENTLTPEPAHREVRAKGWNVAAVGTLPIDEEWSVFGKLGVMRADVKVKDSAERLPFGMKNDPFGRTKNSSASKWSSNLGVGVNCRLSETMGMRLEAERYSKVGKADVTGSTDIDLVTLGLKANF